MHEELAAALEPVLRDLRTTCVVPFDIREPSELYWDGLAGVMLYEPGGSGQGVSVTLGADPAEQTAWLADQAQEWAVEALWSARLPAVWPHCPAHPDSHPLTAKAENGRAAWFCPRTGEQVALIGELPAGA